MKKILWGAAILCLSQMSHGKTCIGKVKEINHWSDGQVDRINFTLVNGTDKIKSSTATKEQVSMILMAFASDTEVKAYWSCSGTKPPSCNETDSFPICGYISLNKND